MGMDPTPEASIEALGDRNMSLMRALNRQYYKNYDTGGGEKTGGGGIMNGGGVGSQSSSVFAPQAKQKEEASAQAQTLTLLEQGAASYDGQSAMGGVAEGAESSLSNLKVKKQQESESNLANLKRYNKNKLNSCNDRGLYLSIDDSGRCSGAPLAHPHRTSLMCLLSILLLFDVMIMSLYELQYKHLLNIPTHISRPD